jgi:hypothetical protein
VPSTAQALSEEAVEDTAVTHAFSDRSARKNWDGEVALRDVTHPIPSRRITYKMKTTLMAPDNSVIGIV